MRHTVQVLLLAVLLCTMLADSGVAATEAGAEALSYRLRKTIEAKNEGERFACRGELICGVADLPDFYARRDFRPAWVMDSSLQAAESLIRGIHSAHFDGLRTSDYHVAELTHMLDTLKADRGRGVADDPELLADLDLLLTDSFLLLSSHLLAGRVNPETVHSEWVVDNPEADLGGALQSALAGGQIEAALDNMRPPHVAYAALKAALQRYREIEFLGGWPVLHQDLAWQKGAFGAHISLLRERLAFAGDLSAAAEPGVGYLFDDALETALRRFQSRHGLPETGVVDIVTLEALNVPAGVRARQIELNLERWRWIPHYLGRRHLLVNVADFKLAVVEDDQPLWDMRVVVGKDYRRTPVFSAKLQYLVINPYWNVPQKIAVEDILPKVRRDPQYLVRKKIKVFESWSADAGEIDPLTVDWSRLNKSNFRFKLRKEPGPQNDLGRIKFMLPNRFAVYLHDTPSRKLFESNIRTFSSGCIRLEKPIDLAEYLLRDDPRWTRKKILEAIESGENFTVRLKEPLPVHLLYWTAWVDHRGIVNFRDDIYNRDPLLDMALKERPPPIGPDALSRVEHDNRPADSKQ